MPHLHMRLTEEERDKLWKEAEERSLPVTTYVKLKLNLIGKKK